jgi:hypothetical protein
MQDEEPFDFPFIEDERARAFMSSEAREIYRVLTRAEDLVPIFLRAHLFSESYLDRIVEAWLPRGDRVTEEARLSYIQKLRLVSAFDRLRDVEMSALSQLNALRNRAAHDPHFTISISDIDRVGRHVWGYEEWRAAHSTDLKVLATVMLAMLNAHLAATLYNIKYLKPPTGPSQGGHAA